MKIWIRVVSVAAVLTIGCGFPLKTNLGSASAVDVHYNSIVNTFEARTFTPADDWFRLYTNEHWQTIVGSGALDKIIFGKEVARTFPTFSKMITTPDGDEFEVEFAANDFTANDNEIVLDNKPMVIILHGLEANAKGVQVTRMTESFLEQNFACVLVSFRSCNGQENKTIGAYHLGFTDDVDLLTKMLHKQYPNRPIYLAGFSLGGNVCLKFLGELGSKCKERNIYGATTMSVPFDLVQSGGKIDQGFNRAIYAENFLSTLKVKAELQYEKFNREVPFDIEKIRACSCIGDFDNEFIAKIYGFEDKNDYYYQCGAKRWLSKIKVPAICINARDDPFVDEKSLPSAEDTGTAPVRLIYTDKGGHCGFVAKRTVASEANDDKWIATEMSRALSHIHQNLEKKA